jgi:TRAP-type mannitol/chloroaromatic compound transport system substrate-binding protein
VQVYSAGEVVPAFEVLDAVGSGAADLGHTAAFFWQGKMPAANFFTTVPFGLTPDEHVAWVEHGGGQALWDELYAPFGVKPFMAGNTGVCMGGWFRREIKSIDDLLGLKLRSLGLGGEVFRRLGATPVSMPPGEAFTALQSGVVDGVEFTAPASDIALGLWRVAPNYAYPGFNKPNGTGECIVARRVWDKLDSQMRAVIAHACATEAAFALSEFERMNADALDALVTKNQVKLFAFPSEVIRGARPHADAILADVARSSDIAKRIHESYSGFRERNSRWSKVSIRAVLEAREG